MEPTLPSRVAAATARCCVAPCSEGSKHHAWRSILIVVRNCCKRAGYGQLTLICDQISLKQIASPPLAMLRHELALGDWKQVRTLLLAGRTYEDWKGMR
jgi:hypothetical protein